MTTETPAEVRRTLSDVQAAASAAGLASTSGPAQLLHFGRELNTEDLKLMEVPADVMDALRTGQRSVSGYESPFYQHTSSLLVVYRLA